MPNKTGFPVDFNLVDVDQPPAMWPATEATSAGVQGIFFENVPLGFAMGIGNQKERRAGLLPWGNAMTRAHPQIQHSLQNGILK